MCTCINMIGYSCWIVLSICPLAEMESCHSSVIHGDMHPKRLGERVSSFFTFFPKSVFKNLGELGVNLILHTCAYWQMYLFLNGDCSLKNWYVLTKSQNQLKAEFLQQLCRYCSNSVRAASGSGFSLAPGHFTQDEQGNTVFLEK